MTKNKTHTLLKRLNSDTFLDKCLNEGISKETKIKILECVDKRVFNRITQKQMSERCCVSLVTIKRFENIQVNDLLLFINYRAILEELPNKKTRHTPKWV